VDVGRRGWPRARGKEGGGEGICVQAGRAARPPGGGEGEGLRTLLYTRPFRFFAFALWMMPRTSSRPSFIRIERRQRASRCPPHEPPRQTPRRAESPSRESQMAAQSASRHQGRNRWVETGGAAGGEAREDEERGQQGRAGVGTCLVALAL